MTVPVVKETWEKDARHLKYYSDKADPAIPTEYSGVPNTEQGKVILFLPLGHTWLKGIVTITLSVWCLSVHLSTNQYSN